MKKTVLYIIDSLDAIGGAEIMLVSPLTEIQESYNVILVTLYGENIYKEKYLIQNKQYCLHMHSRKDILSAVARLKEIIKENNVNLIHSYLYWSTIVARLSSNKNTEHIFSLATMMKEHVYTHKWYSRYTQIIESITYKKKQIVIAPTHEVLKDFDKAVGIKGRAEVIANFVADEFFNNHQSRHDSPDDNTFKLVAVGNLKQVKNYQLFIDAFKLLKSLPITLDIYGDGPLKEDLKKQICDNHLSINIKGSHDAIHSVLPNYDAFVMASFHEGFGISAAEAMATGLPMLLSDISVFREVSKNNAIFFNPYNPESFVNAVEKLVNNKECMQKISDAGRAFANEDYRKKKYIQSLLQLYDEILR